MHNNAIDLDDLLERVQDDWELLIELFDIFTEDYKDKRSNLDGLIGKQDFEQIRNLAHSLKGASGNISAKEFHKTFAEMEQAAAAKDLGVIREKTSALDRQFPELQKCMAKIKEDYKTSGN